MGNASSSTQHNGGAAHADGHELVAEYCDDGHSGARLNRPGLDALRDAAEAGDLRGGVVFVA